MGIGIQWGEGVYSFLKWGCFEFLLLNNEYERFRMMNGGMCFLNPIWVSRVKLWWWLVMGSHNPHCLNKGVGPNGRMMRSFSFIISI